MKQYFCSLGVLTLLISVFNIALAATDGGILSEEEAQTANVETLLADVTVFRNIRQGMKLFMAQCENMENCQTAANTDELEQLISVLDGRIGGLSERRQVTGQPSGLGDVLVAYVDELEGYTRHLDNLQASSSVVDKIDESELFSDDDEATSEIKKMDDIFSDEDEEL
jgi:hypothetical protein